MFRDDVARLFANMDKKKLPLLGVGIFAITSLTGCPTETKSQPKNCTCPEKAHLNEGENCKCGADICSDCTEKINTNLSNGTKVIKEVGVSEADFNTMVEKLNYILAEGLTASKLELFPKKIVEIRVGVSGTITDIQEKILLVGHDEDTSELRRYLSFYLVSIQQSNGTRLASEYEKAKNGITRVNSVTDTLCVLQRAHGNV